METYGEIQQGKRMLTQSQKLQEEHYLTSLKDGTRIKTTHEIDSQPKSHAQVKTIFGLAIMWIVTAFDDRGWDSSMLLNLEKPNGVAVTKGFLKEWFYIIYPMYDGNDKHITLSSRKCGTKQAADFIDNIMKHAATQWSIYIPEPNVNWKKEQAQREPETDV